MCGFFLREDFKPRVDLRPLLCEKILLLFVPCNCGGEGDERIFEACELVFALLPGKGCKTAGQVPGVRQSSRRPAPLRSSGSPR